MKPRSTRWVIGVDEAGRGPLAGPLVVAAVLIEKNTRIRGKIRLKDSKQLTERQRDYWFAWLKARGIAYAVSYVSPERIDRINIARAAHHAATRAVSKLGVRNATVLLDGGLRVSGQFRQKTIIRGDEKIKVIALASVVAKVTRDKKMARLHRRYPQYGFLKHKGYGTRAHFRAINRHGISPHHRLTYLSKYE